MVWRITCRRLSQPRASDDAKLKSGTSNTERPSLGQRIRRQPNRPRVELDVGSSTLAVQCFPFVRLNSLIISISCMKSAVHKHTNRLAREKSPYLLQHAHNPVDWFAWGDEAFEKARVENRPIFLSIGYSTCHWCHVMERESFEDEKVAAFLNAAFRQHQGGSRGAARRGQDLHDLRAGHDRLRRLAAECLSHAGTEAVFRRHLFSAGQSLRSSGLFAIAPANPPGLANPPG